MEENIIEMEKRLETMNETEKTENKEILNKIHKINTRMNLLNNLLLRVEEEIEKKEKLTKKNKTSSNKYGVVHYIKSENYYCMRYYCMRCYCMMCYWYDVLLYYFSSSFSKVDKKSVAD